MLTATYQQILLSARLYKMERRSDQFAMYRAFRVWRERIDVLKSMSGDAVAFQARSSQSTLARLFGAWKKRAELQNDERVVVCALNQRRVETAWEVWVRAT